MRYYKTINGNYLSAIGVGNGGREITEAEYAELMNMISHRPTAPDGYGYRLTAELEWELYEIPAVEADEPTDEEYAEAGKILLGVSE